MPVYPCRQAPVLEDACQETRSPVAAGRRVAGAVPDAIEDWLRQAPGPRDLSRQRRPVGDVGASGREGVSLNDEAVARGACGG
jgi:hypothetical protein